AAFRQETATYESQLYNKQVDTISALIQSARSTSQQIDDIYQHFLDMRKSGQHIDPQIIEDTQRKQSDLFNQFSVDVEKTKLVVPNEVRVGLENNLRKSMFDLAKKAIPRSSKAQQI